MSYISQSENKIPWNHVFPARNRTNVCILIIVRKEPATAQQFIKSIPSQKLTGKCNRVHVITTRRDKDITGTNIQEKRCILNQIRHVHTIVNKLIGLPTKTPTPDHIGDVVNILLRYEWYNSIFSNYEKMVTFTTFSEPFLRSLI